MTFGQQKSLIKADKWTKEVIHVVHVMCKVDTKGASVHYNDKTTFSVCTFRKMNRPRSYL